MESNTKIDQQSVLVTLADDHFRDNTCMYIRDKQLVKKLQLVLLLVVVPISTYNTG